MARARAIARPRRGGEPLAHFEEPFGFLAGFGGVLDAAFFVPKGFPAEAPARKTPSRIAAAVFGAQEAAAPSTAQFGTPLMTKSARMNWSGG